MDFNKQLIGVRDEYIVLIKNELLGPGSEYSVPDAERELITNAPEKRYSIGVLFPQDNIINSENTESMRVEEHPEVDRDDEDDDFSTEKDSMSENGKTVRSKVQADSYANENLDEEIGLASQNLPSSMGITFVVKGNADTICGKVSFATYRRAKLSDCRIPFCPPNPETYAVPAVLAHIMEYETDTSCVRLRKPVKKKEITQTIEWDTLTEEENFALKNIAYRFCDQLNSGHVREPHEAEFALVFSQSDYIDNNRNIDGTKAKITALRRKIGDGVWSVTVMLVNDGNGKPNGTNCLFQPKISFSSSDNSFIFCEYGAISDVSCMDEEEQSLALLYREKRIYGSGLGTSVDWQIDKSGNGTIYTDFFPETEVPSMDFGLPKNDSVSEDMLSMKYLSDLNDTDKDKKLSALKGIVDFYEKWIDGLETAAVDLDVPYRRAAENNIAECRKACDRMYAGIGTLETDENAWNSFQLANRAMFMQREQLRLQAQTANTDRYPDDGELTDLLNKTNYYSAEDKHRWRPFQIAFILMGVNSVVYDDCSERNLVDLIWFPTGGGKTEAYLGLAAFVIFFRRLTHRQTSAGTAVIMRYTLRLLAAQQFTRAATLICACEFIRRDCSAKKHRYPSYELGNEAVTIGLWIGGEHTPNKNGYAKKCLEKLLAATAGSVRNDKEKHNKFQVLKCPWCGTKLVKDSKDGKLVGQWGYKMRDNKHFYLSCPQESCDFNSRLPIQIVDEELYDNPPTLLFGTVDKFAMLPWESAVGSFFAACNDNRAPELIIQDELHLISGPLGTIVGLYETVIDALCKAKGVPPKIIASTATIRRAKEQCSVLYNRNVVQFPPPGLNADDSFFARESKISHEDGVFGRKYIGLMPAGKTKAMMEVRSLAALLQKAKMMDLPDEVKDKIWTLTVYFNSLKDLGKCATLIDDDVKDFIIRMSIRLGTRRDARLIVGSDELTSRVTTTELNETLDKLEKLEYSQGNISNKRYASNVLLATNMISVGIDVPRLNVMLLVGQPKLTSEYIQASSRVGRQYPGVAFVLYDGSKSRDRSHFEQFKAYHESFYRFVEPTGATPFSKPARDRALHAVITAMIRYSAGLSDDRDAARFDREFFAANIDGIRNFIVGRIKEINERADTGLSDDSTEIETEINNFLDAWSRLAKTAPNGNLYFGRRFMVKQPSAGERRLLKAFGSAGYDVSAFDTLTSMRNVDSSIAGNILVWGE
ncbi:Helicase conserved C-terminal domain-containing protein [Desulfotomaculum arcticum]|uniref:Helicase conserved C-terminal domain-containing protein n=1 Tax=Desulfotruncus arcticus DSM 17038 TaxID=1121424 RepID=A0A1I2ZI47_9FIRM|nr:helicase-related protein [Desulfotruncus arcticus]SFH37246.1 Helicase conserved C-terminal domain-containing protein [Desulfotomaculum arcticum] [Desulfotruncus arcticus DSM 17038]